jgi:hypothetical protein
MIGSSVLYLPQCYGKNLQSDVVRFESELDVLGSFPVLPASEDVRVYGSRLMICIGCMVESYSGCGLKPALWMML